MSSWYFFLARLAETIVKRRHGIKPMVSGELTKVAFREGQDVHAGALLFEIDPRPYQAALSKAQASLAKDTRRRGQQGPDRE